MEQQPKQGEELYSATDNEKQSIRDWYQDHNSVQMYNDAMNTMLKLFDTEEHGENENCEILQNIIREMYYRLSELKWISFQEKPLAQCDALKFSGTEEIVGYHPDWIDEDFNPNGTRIGIITDEGEFNCAKWCNYHDAYENVVTYPPTHYHFILTKP